MHAIGEDAWNMFARRAGKEMGKYINKYIKPPISKMDEIRLAIPTNIHLIASKNNITISNNTVNCYSIPRNEAAE